MDPTQLPGPWENEGPRVIGATLSVTIVAFLTFTIRGYVRIKMIRNVGWDDYMMTIAMALSVAGETLVILSVKYGAGQHMYQLDPQTLIKGMRYNYITQPIYLVLLAFVKFSIGFLLLRIAVSRRSRATIIGVMVFIAVYTFCFFLTLMIQCTNLAMLWDPTAKGKCWPVTLLRGFSYTHNTLNVVTDFLLAIIIPTPMLWTLQLKKRQKLAVMGVLSLGLFSTSAALVRFKYIHDYGRMGDFLWDSVDISIWIIVESNIGIVAANLSCMKPLFRRIVNATYGRSKGASSDPKSFTGRFSHGKKSSAYNSLPDDGFKSDGTHELGFVKTNKDFDSVVGADVEKGSIESQKPFAKMGVITRTTKVEVDVNTTSGSSAY